MIHFHKWEKWEELDYEVDYDSCIIPSRLEERKCKICGKTQVREITTEKANHDFRLITKEEVVSFGISSTEKEYYDLPADEGQTIYQWFICNKCKRLKRKRELR